MISKLIIVYVLTAVIAYLLGSINFSIIITKAYLKKDIREFGSGNAGTTNVLRSVGKLPSALTFLGDFLKAVASVLAAVVLYKYVFNIQLGYGDELMNVGKGIGALFVMAGHVWPIYYGFKGGKGVVTGAAISLMMHPIAFAVCIGTFILVMLLSRIVSLSSIIATATFPFSMFVITILYYKNDANANLWYVVVMTVLAVGYAALIIGKHHENIARLRAGTEKKITAKKKEA